MNKIFKYSAMLFGVVGLLGLNACSDDIDPEMTELEVSRLFSPTDIEVRVLNQTTARVSWKPVRNAESYTVEFFENQEKSEEGIFSGTPVRTKSGLKLADIPYSEPGLRGETFYSVRVKAVGAALPESKWIGVGFQTGTEQIFLALGEDDITHNSVTLRWPAGETATTITLTPGDIVHQLTASEIEAGEAVIEDLNSDTDYVAVMKRDGDTRGTMAFRTLVDLGGAIQVFPEDDLLTMIAEAEAGAALALMPGEYVIDGNIPVAKTLSILGVYPHDRPVIKGGIIRMSGLAGLTLRNLIMDGATSDGNQTVVYDEALPDAYGAVVIDGCDITNYTKGVFYASNAVLIESVTITNTVYSNILCEGGDFIDFRNGMTRHLEFTNNTIYNSAADRDLIRMDAGGSSSFPGEPCEVVFTNNTLHNVLDKEGTTRRIMYVRHAENQITVKNNIFSNVVGNYSRQSETNIVEFDRNNYFNSPNLTSDAFTAYDYTTTYLSVNPGFADPSAGDFTVSQEDVVFYNIGAARWIP